MVNSAYMDQTYQPTRRLTIREPFCSLSHGAGAVLAALGTVALVLLAGHRVLYTVAFVIYGASLVLLYSSSAMYHGLDGTPRDIEKLMRMDHAAIYLLIAGTYTPVCLLVLHRALGFPLLAAQYVLAATGISLTLMWRSAPAWIRVTLYLLMGWMIMLSMGQLKVLLPPDAIVWITAGGLSYTIGTVVFATDKPHIWPGRFSAHDLWHLFVLGGSACQFYAIWRFIAMVR